MAEWHSPTTPPFERPVSEGTIGALYSSPVFGAFIIQMWTDVWIVVAFVVFSINARARNHSAPSLSSRTRSPLRHCRVRFGFALCAAGEAKRPAVSQVRRSG